MFHASDFEAITVHSFAVPNRRQKANGWSCSCQQWHPRRLVCDCLSTSYEIWRGVVTARTLAGVKHSLWTVSCDLNPAADTDTNVWAGMQWLDGQKQVVANTVLPQHYPKLFVRKSILSRDRHLSKHVWTSLASSQDFSKCTGRLLENLFDVWPTCCWPHIT